ncbi:hypothetical protein HID58_056425, partial [Brassica napus]
ELLISELKSGRFMQTVVARRVKKSGGSRPGQLNKLLEKERQRAAENTQEYLAAKEEADTIEGRANQLERKDKQVLQKVKLHNELIQKVLRSLTEETITSDFQTLCF